MKYENKKPILFIIPAILVAALVIASLPATQPVLRDIPERLELILPAVAEAATPEPEEETTAAEEETETEAESQNEINYGYADGVYTGCSQGFGGTIEVSVTVEGGRMTEIIILNAPGETEPYFSLAKTVLNIVTEKQTWDVDTVSGATYSSRGILGAIRNAITGEMVQNETPQQTQPVADVVVYEDPSEYIDGVYTGTAQGFGGPITVEVVISGGFITRITVLDAEDETPEYFNRASAVIGTIIAAGTPNVDTVSGATYSSSGIISAVKRALARAAKDPEGMEEETEPESEEETETGSEPESETEEETLPALADGTFESVVSCLPDRKEQFDPYDIGIKIVLEGGMITSIDAQPLEGYSEDNDTYWDYALYGRTLKRTGVYYEGVISQILDKQKTHVDVVSGATCTSLALMRGVREALGKAGIEEEEPTAEEEIETEEETASEPETPEAETGNEEETTGAEEETSGSEEETTGEEETTETPEIPDEPSGYTDGLYTMSAVCSPDEDYSFDDYEISITLSISDGAITGIEADPGDGYHEDNDTYWDWALVTGRTRKGVFYEDVISQILKSQSADDVDIVSGATCTSETVINAARTLLARASSGKSGQDSLPRCISLRLPDALAESREDEE